MSRLDPPVYYNLSDWLDKTNNAEETHEKILKDVVLNMKDKGFQTLKSRSFDLFTRKSENQILWEIKSTNTYNSVSQGEKGIIQLLRYAIAMSQGNFSGVKFNLLLQNSNQPAIIQYLSRMAKQAGIEIWLYDEKRNWPERIFNLKNKTFLGF
jgi:hypothetical protein